MNTPSEIVRHWWEYYRPRPFWRMVELFVARIFRGGGDADTEGFNLGIGLALTLLAMPGGFISLLLLNKYASFLQWLRGATNVDPLAISFPDEYFFIVLSMTVTGAAVDAQQNRPAGGSLSAVTAVWIMTSSKPFAVGLDRPSSAGKSISCEVNPAKGTSPRSTFIWASSLNGRSLMLASRATGPARCEKMSPSRRSRSAPQCLQEAT